MKVAANSNVAREERRAEARAPARLDGWITTGGYGAARCVVIDLSAEGAQITAPLGLRIGDRLLLSAEGVSRRHASVVWIDADIVGLRFT